MNLELAFDLPYPRSAVWPAFGDLRLLVSCMPGATLRSPAEERPLLLDFAVKLGPIGAKFVGEGNIVYGDYDGALTGAGTDRSTSSRVKGAARFRLEEYGGGTHVHIDVDFALSGVLAQFGRGGIIKELASGIARQFCANLQARLAGDLDGSNVQPAPGKGVPLNAAKLVWDVVRDRFTTPGSNDDEPAR